MTGEDRHKMKIATYVGRESSGELLKLPQLRPDVDLVLLVQQDGEERLRAARVLDGLGREEHVLGSGFVILAVQRCAARRLLLFLQLPLLLACGVFEEKNDAIHRAVRGQINMPFQVS